MKHTWIYVLSAALVGWALPLGGPAAAPLDHRMTGGTGYATASTPSSERATKSPMAAAAKLDDRRTSERPDKDGKPAASEGSRKARYLVVGSFRRMGDADRLAARLTGVSVAVTPAVIDENVFFRVVTGPFAGDDLTSARERLAASGISESWSINLCSADLSAPPCATQ